MLSTIAYRWRCWRIACAGFAVRRSAVRLGHARDRHALLLGQLHDPVRVPWRRIARDLCLAGFVAMFIVGPLCLRLAGLVGSR